MYGNPQTRPDTGVDLNDAPAGASGGLWLGLPSARDSFDPSTLSAEDQRRFADLRGPRRRADFEVSRALLAFAATVAESEPAARSISHAAEHAALLLAPSGCRAGVDLEFKRPRDVLRLARFAFTESEFLALDAATDDARPRMFYILWTLKEAFAKALQLDLVDALRQCVFWNEGGEWRGQVPTTEAWGATVFEPRPGMFLAAACTGEPLQQLRQWEWPPKRRGSWPVLASVDAPAVVRATQA